MHDVLFEPIKIGALNLKNRIIMSPMTRGRADAGGIPNEMMAQYYAQRASAGLIITEATAISEQGYGWAGSPGIYNDAHVAGWRKVTDAVHAKGGLIVLQLWHMGRVSHPDFQNGQKPVGPSAIAAEGMAYTPTGRKPYVEPRALRADEIPAIIRDYVKAGQRAMSAGFDGVEIHAANGYLIDQFIRDGANKRTDDYGGSIENRLHFLLEVTEGLAKAVGANRLGIRVSPLNPHNGMSDSDPVATYTLLAELLNGYRPAYLDVMEALPGHRYANDKAEPIHPHIRREFKGTIILNGGQTAETAEKVIKNKQADAVAFGVPFIANPDLPARLKTGADLRQADTETYYQGGANGYIDYPGAVA